MKTGVPVHPIDRVTTRPENVAVLREQEVPNVKKLAQRVDGVRTAKANATVMNETQT